MRAWTSPTFARAMGDLPPRPSRARPVSRSARPQSRGLIRPSSRSTNRLSDASAGFAATLARGDLPIRAGRDSSHVEWLTEFDSLDYARVLPQLLQGLRTDDLHLRAVAEHGALDMLEALPDRAADCVPQAVSALKSSSAGGNPATWRRKA